MLDGIQEEQKHLKRVLEENIPYWIRFNALLEGFPYKSWSRESQTDNARKYLQNILNLSIQRYGDRT